MSKNPAEDFFFKHAGYGYTPGKETKAQGQRRGAKLLAKAEAYASAHGWKCEWEDDPDGWQDVSEDDDVDEVLCCVLRDMNGTVLGSLSSIQFGRNHVQNRQYGRVVEAELALEAMKS